MAHFSDMDKSNGKDYCIFFNSQWARLPQDLNKAVSHRPSTTHHHLESNNSDAVYHQWASQCASESDCTLHYTRSGWHSMRCFSGSFSEDTG